MALFMPFCAFAQCDYEKEYCLRVCDIEGFCLANALIETDLGKVLTCDVNGKVSIPKEALFEDLTVVYMGYPDTTIHVSGLKKVSVTHIYLESEISALHEIVVLGRNMRTREDLAQEILLLTKDEINSLNPSSTTDILEKSGSLFVQKSQFGGGSPIIRGFEANRILLVSDHVRMNNAIYRAGHLQNSVTIDPFLLQGVEVIYGPNSLLYGSDALGGVIHYLSKKPKFQTGNPGALKELNYAFNLGSAAQEKGAHADFNYGTSKIAFLTSFSLVDFGELRAGRNRDSRYPQWGLRSEYSSRLNGEDQIVKNDKSHIQIGTQYNQLDITQKVAIKVKDDVLLGLNFQHSSSSDIPRYDQLSEVGDEEGTLKWAEWYYGPQNRTLFSVDLKNTKKTKIYDHASYILSYQSIDEDRITRRFGREERDHQLVTVHLWSMTADFQKGLDSLNFLPKISRYLSGAQLSYGLDAKLNNVLSNAFQENINDGSRNFNVLSRYPNDKAKLNAFAGYLSMENKFKEERLSLQLGVRLGTESIHLRYRENDIVDWPESYLEGIDNTLFVSSWSVGGVWKQNPKWRIRAAISSAYRNPNIDDQAKIRIKAGEISIPNLSLKPERSYNAEIGSQKEFDLPYPFSEASAYISMYYSILRNAIGQQNFSLPNGDSTLRSQNQELITVANTNAQLSKIRGITLGFSSEILDLLDFSANFNYTRGQSEAQDGTSFPRAHIPPVYGVISLKHQRKLWSVAMDYRYNGSKSIDRYGTDSSENLEFATVDGTPAWSTWNISGSYQFSEKFNISGGIDNLFDKHYRTFSSGVSAPGRNLFIRARGRL